MLHHRHWTPDQANALLPIVGETVRSLRDARRRLVERGYDSDLAERADTTGGAWAGTEHARAAIEVALGFERLERLDEPAVGHWHGVEAGFAGRRPLAS